MSKRSIPRNRWASFFAGYSRSHEGWLSTIDVSQAGSAPAVEAVDLPLLDIRIQGSGDGECSIAIEAGARHGNHVVHTVCNPVIVGYDVTADGADEGIHIKTARGVTRLRFRVAAAPESLDGMMVSGHQRG